MVGDGERKEVSPKASLVMAVLLGAAVGYLGVSLILLAFRLFDAGDTMVGVLSLLFGLVLVAGVLTVIGSQARAVFGRRG